MEEKVEAYNQLGQSILPIPNEPSNRIKKYVKYIDDAINWVNQSTSIENTKPKARYAYFKAIETLFLLQLTNS